MSGRHGPVAVFGATGFIGRNLVRSLESAGIEVIIPTTRAGGRPDIAGPIEELVDGIGNATVVVNAAGSAHLHTQDPSRFWAANTTGAGRVAQAAVASAKVSRLIHVSSLAVGSGGIEPPVLDTEPFTAYGASKAAGEIAVSAALNGAAMELIVIRPAGIGGIDSPGSWGTIRRLVEGNKRVPVPDSDVKYDVVEISDVVTFIEAAVRGEIEAGAHALTGSHPMTLEEYARRIAAAKGRSARIIRIPTWLLKGAAKPASMLGRAAARAGRVEQLVSTLTEQRPLVERRPGADTAIVK